MPEKVGKHFFSAIVDQILFIFSSRFCLFCAFTRLRYQVSVYRTIGPLVSSYHRHQFCFMYRFFILVIFVLCNFLRHACKMHFCIVHDIIYDSAYTIDQVGGHPVVLTVIVSLN